jgi:hypothetical protein
MIVGCIIDLLANCEFRHRKLLFGIIETLTTILSN